MSYLHYRPEIDGLRTISILSIIFYHLEINFFNGGFVGVDVFFVISGYLISAIINKDLEKKKFNLANFYLRRAKRIIPNLLFYSFFSLFLIILFFPPYLIKNYGLSLVANSLFLSNFFFYFKIDYFNNLVDLSPLLHTWSLSLEIQYYILFPLVLFLIKNYFQDFKILIILFLSLLSLFYSQNELYKDQQFVFYMLTTRFWEFGAGYFAEILSKRVENRVNIKFHSFFSNIGIFIVFFSIFYFDKKTPFPGLAAIPVVTGSLLVIVFLNKNQLIGKILTSKVFVNLGKLSFSLYLSHYVILVILKSTDFNNESLIIKLFVIFISFTVSIFSYFFVENKFRYKKLNVKNLTFSFLIVTSFLIFSGSFLYFTEGLKKLKINYFIEKDKKIIVDYEKILKEREIMGQYLVSSNLDFKKNNINKVLIVGDSLAEDFYLSTLTLNFDKNEFRRLELYQSCMSDKIIFYDNRICKNQLKNFFESKLYSNSDEILIVVNWQKIYNKSTYKFIKKILYDKKKVTLFSSGNFNNVMLRSFNLLKNNIHHEASFWYDNIKIEARNNYLSLVRVIQKNNLGVVFRDKLNVFCNFEKKTCNLRNKNNWYIYDTVHLTNAGLVFFARGIQSLGWYL